jgi:hypothetical protein
MLKQLQHTLAVAVVLMASAAAFAQQTETIGAGLTSVTLSSEFTGALQSLGVTAATIAPAQLSNGVAAFPVTGSAIDLKTMKGEIIHSGGLSLTAGNTNVRLQSFIIDTTGSAPVLTGLVVVNGAVVGRVPLFDISLSGSNISNSDSVLKVTGVALTLNHSAATALNQSFGVSTFQAGIPIGTAKVIAILEGD